MNTNSSRLDSTAIEFRLEAYRRQMTEFQVDPELQDYILGLVGSIYEMGQECAIRDEAIASRDVTIATLQEEVFRQSGPAWPRWAGLLTIGLAIGLLCGLSL